MCPSRSDKQQACLLGLAPAQHTDLTCFSFSLVHPPPPPRQVLHRDRVLFNVRNGWDVARFLADPRREDVEAHRDNLARLAAERGYRRGWCGHMLRLRWGGATLRALGVEPC